MRADVHQKSFEETSNDNFDYCFVVFDNSSDNAFRKLALDVLIIMSNMPTHEGYLLGRRNTDLIRGIKVIMNEMNSFDVKHCTTNVSNFLIFKKISFKNFGNHHLIYESMTTFFAKIGYKLSYVILNENKRKANIFIDLKLFNEWFVKNSKLIQYFLKKINIIWRGSVQSVEGVFIYEEYIILNPRHLYELYDMYFAFNAAIVFVHLKTVVHVGDNDLSFISNNFTAVIEILNMNGENWCKMFPQKMQFLEDDINTLLYNFKNHTDGNMLILFKKMKNIENKPNELNIVLIEKNPTTFRQIFTTFNSKIKTVNEERNWLLDLNDTLKFINYLK